MTTMIAIINQGDDKDGEALYTVQINKTLITLFRHERKKGLAACLREAALAVERAEYERWIDTYEQHAER